MPSEVSHDFCIKFRPEEREILERRAAGRPIAAPRRIKGSRRTRAPLSSAAKAGDDGGGDSSSSGGGSSDGEPPPPLAWEPDPKPPCPALQSRRPARVLAGSASPPSPALGAAFHAADAAPSRLEFRQASSPIFQCTAEECMALVYIISAFGSLRINTDFDKGELIQSLLATCPRLDAVGITMHPRLAATWAAACPDIPLVVMEHLSDFWRAATQLRRVASDIERLTQSPSRTVEQTLVAVEKLAAKVSEEKCEVADG